jgi:hypothetical protein
MGETRKPLSFGPSERYLPSKKLQVGDVLTFNITDIETEEVDTEFGSKLEFYINVLSSSTEVVSVGKYTWRTVAAAPRSIHKYYLENISATSPFRKDFMTWVWKLTVVEHGFQLDEIA